MLDRDEFAAAMSADDSLAAALTAGGGSNLDAATAVELEKFNELVRHSLLHTVAHCQCSICSYQC